MPTTYERCPKAVSDLAREILCEFETHKPLLDAKAKIDFVFAYPELDEKTDEPIAPALKKNGHAMLGIARKVSLKDRALGRGDAEIALDAHWWDNAKDKEKAALLDHELHHFAVKTDAGGNYVFDDLERPVIQIRKHDHEFGWFMIIAKRHGEASPECIQAAKMFDQAGQLYWPLLEKVERALAAR
jgi:hypothetical protein